MKDEKNFILHPSSLILHPLLNAYLGPSLVKQFFGLGILHFEQFELLAHFGNININGWVAEQIFVDKTILHRSHV